MTWQRSKTGLDAKFGRGKMRVRDEHISVAGKNCKVFGKSRFTQLLRPPVRSAPAIRSAKGGSHQIKFPIHSFILRARRGLRTAVVACQAMASMIVPIFVSWIVC